MERDEAARFVPLVKSVVTAIRRDLDPELKANELEKFGMEGLSDALLQYRSRQGLTRRDYLIYRIKGAIYSGISQRDWQTSGKREKYLFLKKANELLLSFHLSAEGTVKRSIKAEEQELLYLLNLLTTSAFLCERVVSGAELDLGVLTTPEREFIRCYYDEDLDLAPVAALLRLSVGAASRMHFKILEKLTKSLPPG